MSTRIVYCGCERCDFIYHLITVLSTKGTVLAADNSYKGDLFDCVCREEGADTFEWRNITYVRDMDIKSDTEDFEYVVIYGGEAPCEEWMNDKAFILAMPDYTRSSIDAMTSLSEYLGMENTTIIMRDKCSKKIAEKSIAALLGISLKKIDGYIPVTSTDMAAYVALTHNKYCNIKAVSDSMLTAITFVVAKLFNLDEKAATKTVAGARKVR